MHEEEINNRLINNSVPRNTMVIMHGQAAGLHVDVDITIIDASSFLQ